LREIVAGIVCQMAIADLEQIFDEANIPFSPGLPFCIDDAAPELRMQPPGAGEHTDTILHALGYSADRIDALRRSRAVS
jgi:crotonobetainyl-CoA:carnitine CoA-transferase CaiB-like acyl-CoA transferase